VIGPERRTLEVQIRSREMHQRAEWGAAAHWSYKGDSLSDDIAALNRMIDWQRVSLDPVVFMETLKTDLEQGEVFVFTPKGKVIALPVGATPLDFAYSVHTEVGHACIGATVNGRPVPLEHKLQSGDTCEVFTSNVEGAGPSSDWLELVVSPRARNKIRQWLARERRGDAIEAGREELILLPVQEAGDSDVLVRLSRCCMPVLGDEIIGFLTRGQGINVHRSDCGNARALANAQAARMIEVEWDNVADHGVFIASIVVKALDRSKLLLDVTNAISEYQVNIVACSTRTGSDRISKMRFDFEMADPGHLDAVLRTVKNIDGVQDAYRLRRGL
jgi:(p)ppGpp synthase/HD superfamily hydrolase